jgi:hypothetical protein
MFLVACGVFLLASTNAYSQAPRTAISSGAGWYSTVGQPIVSFSKGSPNLLWQGFWVPKNTVTSVAVNSTPNTVTKIFPNPASANVTIETTKPFVGISIFDAAGNAVQYFSSNTSSVTNIPTGVYSVRITFIDNSVENHRLIIYR